jgi:hypothetical protein
LSVRRPTFVRGSALVVCATLLLSGCGGSADGGTPAASEQPAPTASASASAEPTDTATQDPTGTPTATETPTKDPTPSPGVPGVAFEPTECKEPKLDTDGVEMVAVKLARTGDTITATFTDDQPAPDTKDLLWSVWATRTGDGSGPRIVQLGAEISDGEEIAHFVFAGGTQTNLSKGEGFDVSGKRMTATFPASAVTDLGRGARWYASLTVEQETMDYCPGGRGVDRDKITGIEFPASWY